MGGGDKGAAGAGAARVLALALALALAEGEASAGGVLASAPVPDGAASAGAFLTAGSRPDATAVARDAAPEPAAAPPDGDGWGVQRALLATRAYVVAPGRLALLGGAAAELALPPVAPPAGGTPPLGLGGTYLAEAGLAPNLQASVCLATSQQGSRGVLRLAAEAAGVRWAPFGPPRAAARPSATLGYVRLDGRSPQVALGVQVGGSTRSLRGEADLTASRAIIVTDRTLRLRLGAGVLLGVDCARTLALGAALAGAVGRGDAAGAGVGGEALAGPALRWRPLPEVAVLLHVLAGPRWPVDARRDAALAGRVALVYGP